MVNFCLSSSWSRNDKKVDREKSYTSIDVQNAAIQYVQKRNNNSKYNGQLNITLSAK